MLCSKELPNALSNTWRPNGSVTRFRVDFVAPQMQRACNTLGRLRVAWPLRVLRGERGGCPMALVAA
eukprot:5527088-Alexandrium_andersonii.AAC.1